MLQRLKLPGAPGANAIEFRSSLGFGNCSVLSRDPRQMKQTLEQQVLRGGQRIGL